MKNINGIIILSLIVCLGLIHGVKGDEDFFDIMFMKYPKGEGLFSMEVDTLWVCGQVKDKAAKKLHVTPDVIRLRDLKGTIMDDNTNIMQYSYGNIYSYPAMYVEFVQ